MNHLKELRVAHGYKSQSELAKVLHVNQTAVSQWERGVTTPSPPILKKLSDMYGVSIEYLLGYASMADANDGFYTIDKEGNRHYFGAAEKTAAPEGSGRRAEVNRLFDALSQDQQDAVLAVMRGMQQDP